MHLRVLIVFFAVALLSLSWQVEGGKLQIGVKKKVENCERRTKKGDRLQMHYTVRPHPQTTDIMSLTLMTGYIERGWVCI